MDDVVIVNATGVTITADPTTLIPGKEYRIKARGGIVPVTVRTPPASGKSIDGQPTQTISATWGFMEIVTDGSDWFIVSKG